MWPSSPFYSEGIADQVKFDLELCAMVLDNLGVTDMDNDGKREYVEYSKTQDINIDLIVCSESAGKGRHSKAFASRTWAALASP